MWSNGQSLESPMSATLDLFKHGNSEQQLDCLLGARGLGSAGSSY